VRSKHNNHDKKNLAFPETNIPKGKGFGAPGPFGATVLPMHHRITKDEQKIVTKLQTETSSTG
jgi:hypothetical protein